MYSYETPRPLDDSQLSATRRPRGRQSRLAGSESTTVGFIMGDQWTSCLKEYGAANIYELKCGNIDVEGTIKRLQTHANGKRVKNKQLKGYLLQQRTKLAKLRASTSSEADEDPRLWAILRPEAREHFDHVNHRGLGQMLLQTLAPHTLSSHSPWYTVNHPLQVKGVLTIFIHGMDGAQWDALEDGVQEIQENTLHVEQSDADPTKMWPADRPTSFWMGADVRALLGEVRPREVDTVFYDGMMCRGTRIKQKVKQRTASLCDFVLTQEEMETHAYPAVAKDSYESAMSNLRIATIAQVRLKDGAPLLAMDCEMVETEYGSALARVAVVDGATRATVLDMLVMPESPVTDYLTPYSGISESTLVGVTNTLADAQAAVRKLIADTAAAHDQTMPILVGHSLENDLGALQLAYPLVLDSAVIYSKAGSIFKKKLSKLTRQYLKREIQEGTDGHSPAEDALASLELCKRAIEKDDLSFRVPTHEFEPLPKVLWDAKTLLRTEAVVISADPVYLDESIIGDSATVTAHQTADDAETVASTVSVLDRQGGSTVAGVHKLLCISCLAAGQGVGGRVQAMVDAAPAGFVMMVVAVPDAVEGQVDLSRPGRVLVATKQQ
ncbi:RNA exonuclease [Carpediemonas membranifera]|uniref:RNA exonuclease n=1 Tax=Carpediemonas membranifera TaxID=201153 RepID=A0A8J6ARC8_9EUKA|nr:RNA exonuclease [Carpediemonas membranifera]|eukprot:KAG9392341.1 RNA exonuclease [Carpediemonas membranifera]